MPASEMDSPLPETVTPVPASGAENEPAVIDNVSVNESPSASASVALEKFTGLLLVSSLKVSEPGKEVAVGQALPPVTVSVAVSDALENAVLPPRVDTFTREPAEPVDLSQATYVSVGVAMEFRVGTNLMRLVAAPVVVPSKSTAELVESIVDATELNSVHVVPLSNE